MVATVGRSSIIHFVRVDSTRRLCLKSRLKEHCSWCTWRMILSRHALSGKKFRARARHAACGSALRGQKVNDQVITACVQSSALIATHSSGLRRTQPAPQRCRRAGDDVVRSRPELSCAADGWYELCLPQCTAPRPTSQAPRAVTMLCCPALKADLRRLSPCLLGVPASLTCRPLRPCTSYSLCFPTGFLAFLMSRSPVMIMMLFVWMFEYRARLIGAAFCATWQMIGADVVEAGFDSAYWPKAS